MNFTKKQPFVIFSVVFFFIVIICYNYYNKYTIRLNKIARDVSKLHNDKSFIGSSNSNIFWIVQLSDLHISKFNRFPTLVSDLENFLQTKLSIISPDLVLVTGDLTDAKTRNLQDSGQYLDEWLTYRRIIDKSGIRNSSVWLDLKGNHDGFNLLSAEDERNYFRAYSRSAVPHDRSFAYELQMPFGRYCFVGVDATPNPGPRRPFNFFGVLSQDDLDDLWSLSDRCVSSANHTLWFGHYPTSVIVSPWPGLRSLLRESIAYVCGHFHTFGRTAEGNMYSRHADGSLELELGDWKENRYYRVLAFDHDILSFTDVRYSPADRTPLVLLTNPARYASPNEPYDSRVRASTHIRMLIFSDDPIKSVTVSINDHLVGTATPLQVRRSRAGTSHLQEPLFTLPWNPTHYASGVHTIRVNVTTSTGEMTSSEHPFSLSEPLSFPLYPSILLDANGPLIGQLLFFASFVVSISPTLLGRFGSRRLVSRLCPAAALVASIDRLFCLLLAYGVYVLFGPWFVGEVVSGHVGVLFSVGFLINGQTVPTGVTYVFGCVELLTFYLPITLVLAWRLRSNLRGFQSEASEVASGRNNLSAIALIFSALLIWQAALTFLIFYLPYGVMAALCSPVGLGGVVWASLVWRVVDGVTRFEMEKASACARS